MCGVETRDMGAFQNLRLGASVGRARTWRPGRCPMAVRRQVLMTIVVQIDRDRCRRREVPSPFVPLVASAPCGIGLGCGCDLACAPGQALCSTKPSPALVVLLTAC